MSNTSLQTLIVQIKDAFVNLVSGSASKPIIRMIPPKDTVGCQCESYEEHKAHGFQCASTPPELYQGECPYLASLSSSIAYAETPSPECAMHPDLDPESFDVIQDMEVDEYQANALKTSACPVIGHSIIYPLLGMIGEMGEVIEKINLHSLPGHTPPWQGSSRIDITKELGDVLWYAAVMAHILGKPLSVVMQFKFFNAYQELAAKNHRILKKKFQPLSIFLPESHEEFLDKKSHPLADFIPEAQDELVVSVGKMAERIKKVFRDGGGQFDEAKNDELIELLKNVIMAIAVLSKTLNIHLSVVGEMNIEKLLSRRARNKIHGDGDDR